MAAPPLCSLGVDEYNLSPYYAGFETRLYAELIDLACVAVLEVEDHNEVAGSARGGLGEPLEDFSRLGEFAFQFG